MSPASRRRSRRWRATTGHGARTDLELADAARVLAARALEQPAGLGDHPLVVEGLGERLCALVRWVPGASSTDHRRRCYTSRTIWFVIVACACGLRVGVRGRRRRCDGARGRAAATRVRVRAALPVMGRAAARVGDWRGCGELLLYLPSVYDARLPTAREQKRTCFASEPPESRRAVAATSRRRHRQFGEDWGRFRLAVRRLVSLWAR